MIEEKQENQSSVSQYHQLDPKEPDALSNRPTLEQVELDTSALNQQGEMNAYAVFLLTNVFYEAEEAESSASHTALSLFRILSFMLAATAGISFIGPAMAVFDDETLATIFAITTVISFGSGAIWGWMKMLDEFEPASQSEKDITGSLSSTKQIGIASVSLILGAFSSSSSSYVAFKYNRSLVWPIINLLSSTGLHTYGYNSIFKKLYKSGNVYNKIAKLWDDKAQQSNQYHTMISAGKSKFIQDFNLGLINLPVNYSLPFDTQERDAFLLIRYIIKLGREKHKSEEMNSYVWWANKVFAALARILPLSYSVISAVLSYKAASALSDNVPFRVFFTGISILPNVAIEIIGNNNIFNNLTNKVRNRGFNNSVLANTYPLTFKGTGGFLLANGLFSVIGGAFVTKLALGDSLNPVDPLFIAMATAAEVVTKIYMATDLCNDLLKSGFIRWADNDVKFKIKRERALQHFVKLIDNSKPEMFHNLLAQIRTAQSQVAVNTSIVTHGTTPQASGDNNVVTFQSQGGYQPKLFPVPRRSTAMVSSAAQAQPSVTESSHRLPKRYGSVSK